MIRFFTVAAILFSSQLWAQERIDSLETVTVTANKYSTKTTETGKVVTIISRAEIEHAGSRDLAQVITELGGVFINGYTGNAGKEKNIYLRGAKVDYTLITIDGIPVYDASGIGSNFDIRYIPIDNVERIEILKGSQSTLYGSDAIAGVINIITKKGNNKPFSFSGTAHYGSYDTRRISTSFNGKSGLFDYNVGLTHFKTGGFSEAEKPATVSSNFDNDAYEQNAAQVSIGIQAANGFKIQPFVRYSKNKGSLDQDAFVDEKDYTYEGKNFQAGLRNILSVGGGQLNLLYQFNKTDRSYLDDTTLSRNGSYYVYNQSSYAANEHFAEAFLVYPIKSVKLTAGADFRSSGTSYSAVQKNIYSPLVSRPAFGKDSVKQNQLGVYAALNYSANSFNIEAGGRLNKHSEYGSNFAFNINPSYLIGKSVKIFFNASTGYKVPSLYQLFSEYGNKQLEPENSLNLEGGLQLQSKNDKSYVRASYFNREIKDAIAFFFNPIIFQAYYINQDKQEDHGFEIEAKTNIEDKVNLKLIYSYVDGKITTKENGKDTTYFNLLRRPKSNLTFSIGSNLTKSLYLMAQATAVGKSKDVYFDANFQRNDITLDNYVLLNVHAEYSLLNNKLKLFGDARNITGKKYADIYGYNTAGFNAYGGISFHF